jgi:uncharacterized protein
MGKYVLLVVGVLVVYWLVRASLRRRDKAAPPKVATENMVRCAECGIHLPRGESFTVRGQFYCCAEHQRQHDPDH